MGIQVGGHSIKVVTQYPLNIELLYTKKAGGHEVGVVHNWYKYPLHAFSMYGSFIFCEILSSNFFGSS